MKQHTQQENQSNRRRKYDLVNFTKMHGLGNDFMVVENLTQKVQLTPELIKSWSHRHTGVGFDQLLLLSPPKSADVDFHYSIFNADGSEAGQCGNGTRAIARFILDQRLSLKSENSLATSTNTMTARILESGDAQVDMDTPRFDPVDIPLDMAFTRQPEQSPAFVQGGPYAFTFNEQEVLFYSLSVGNPHAVIFIDDIAKAPEDIAHALQDSPIFPEGVNVGFAKVIDDNTLKLRVFERGAGETQACGSGATAAAIAAINAKKLKGPKVQVQLPGGDLELFWDGAKLQMTGPATRVFTGRLLVKHTPAQ